MRSSMLRIVGGSVVRTMVDYTNDQGSSPGLDTFSLSWPYAYHENNGIFTHNNIFNHEKVMIKLPIYRRLDPYCFTLKYF